MGRRLCVGLSRNPVGVVAKLRDPSSAVPKVAEYGNLGLRDATPLGLWQNSVTRRLPFPR